MTDEYTAIVGTYTDGPSEGLYTVGIDEERGAVTERGTTEAGENPSFIALHPSGDYLYAVNEIDEGAVTAFGVEDGHLVQLNRVETGGGADPCHCSVDATGDYLFVAHYTGGTVAVCTIREDGTVANPQVIEHHESGVDPERQDAPHPHSIQPGPNNEFVYAPDLGGDRVYIYDLDHDDGSLVPADPAFVELPDGAGPRHLDFHPDESHAYLINELDSTVTTFERDAETGALDVLDHVSTLPDGYTDDNDTADIHVHPSGEYVYGSNRGHDSIAVFEVTDDYTLDRVGIESTRGEWPRNFAITPDGDHLLAENMDSDTVVTFAIDDLGELSATGDSTEIPSPVCLRFLG